MYLFFSPDLHDRQRALEVALVSHYALPKRALPMYFYDNTYCSKKPSKALVRLSY